MSENRDREIIRIERLTLLVRYISVLLVLIIVSIFVILYLLHQPAVKQQCEQVVKAEQTTSSLFWIAPDTATITNDSIREWILLGRAIITNTSAYFGATGTVRKQATNGMNCQNCHLDAGTKIFGNNYGSVYSTYPKYRARSGGIENIHKRINDCFERSLNGLALDTASREMRAIVAYITWLGSGVPKGEKANGSGLKDIRLLTRAADPDKGSVVYINKCQQCHQAGGQGQMNLTKTAFIYPPLWGDQSYNIGAGLYRISTFAKFVKYNMPQGASHTQTQLTDEEAWDVAAFVNSQPRPVKDISRDWPYISEKPMDHPFGPFADDFSETQHKYGPYQPIIDNMKNLKKQTTAKL